MTMVRCGNPMCFDDRCVSPHPGQYGYEKANREVRARQDAYYQRQRELFFGKALEIKKEENIGKDGGR